MKHSKLYGLMLLSLTGVGLINSQDASAKVDLKLPANLVIPTCDNFLNIRENPTSDSAIVGRLELDSSAIATGEVSGSWIKIQSGEVIGWVYTPYTVKGAEAARYINKHLKDFSITAKYLHPTTVYDSYKNAKNSDENSTYSMYAILDDSSKIYLPGKKVEKREKLVKKSVVRVRSGVINVRVHRTASYDDNTIMYVDDGEVFEYLGKSGDFYKIKTKKGTGYITNKYSKKASIKKGGVVKRTQRHELADVEFESGNGYPVTPVDKTFSKIDIDGTDYLVKQADVEIQCIMDDSSSGEMVNTGVESIVYGVKKGVVEVDGYGTNSAPDVEKLISDENYEPAHLYVKESNVKYDIKFTDATTREELESDPEFWDYLVENNEVHNYSDDQNNNTALSDQQEDSENEAVLTEDDNKNGDYNYTFDYGDSSTEERDSIIEYAMRFLGNPYVWGGTSLTHGCDCSGYVQSIYRHFGINIGRTTSNQCSESRGKRISANNIKPGDLIYYTHNGRTPYHVVMYLGDNKCINASSKKNGICVSDIKTNSILMIKNYID